MSDPAHFAVLLHPYGVHPASTPPADTSPTIDDWVFYARQAERAGIDAIFLADAPTVSSEGARWASLEPLTLLSALARETTSWPPASPI